MNAQPTPRLWVPGVVYIHDSGRVEMGKSAGWCLPKPQKIDDWKREEHFAFRRTKPSKSLGEATQRWLRTLPLQCVRDDSNTTITVAYHRVSGGGSVTANGKEEELGTQDISLAEGAQGDLDDALLGFIDRKLRKVSRGRLTHDLVCAAVEAADIAGQSPLRARTIEALWQQIFDRSDEQRDLAERVVAALKAAGSKETQVDVDGFGRLERIAIPAVQDADGAMVVPEWTGWRLTDHDGWAPQIPDDVSQERQAQASQRAAYSRWMNRLYSVQTATGLLVLGVLGLGIWQPELGLGAAVVVALFAGWVAWKRGRDPDWIRARARKTRHPRPEELPKARRETAAVAAAWERIGETKEAIAAYGNLSRLCTELNEDTASEAADQRAYDLTMGLAPPDRPPFVQQNYLYAQLRRGQVDLAERLARAQLSAETVSEAKAGRIAVLATVLCKKGANEEAQDLARQILALCEGTQNRVWAVRQAAIIFEAGERWQEAADLFGQLLEIIVSAHGDKPELTSFAKEGLARALGELDG